MTYGWAGRPAPAARPAQTAAPPAVADHRDDGLREVRAAERGERIPPVLVENEEQVPRRRVLVDPVEAQAVDCCERRRVGRVVPVRCDLRVLEHAFASSHQVVAVHLDVLQQLEVVRGPADRDPHAGTRLGKAAVLEEDPLELPEHDLEHVRPGRKRDARDELGHVGVDHHSASAPREGGAMVTVDHEVRLAELDRDDRRERAVGEGLFERAQPVAAEVMKRAEVAGERAGAAVGADERVERDLADAQIPAPERLQSPLDLVELEQSVAAAGPQPLHLEVKLITGERVAQRTTNARTRRAFKEFGGVLLSREVALRVPSALTGLTSLFGMGRGVPPSL